MKFNTPLSFVLLVAFVVTATSCISDPTAEMKAKHYAGAFLVDVRTPEEFAEGSVTGAVNIPLDELDSRLDEFKGKESIVVFCRSGNRSAKAVDILNYNGFINVANGGSWQDVQQVIEKRSSESGQ